MALLLDTHAFIWYLEGDTQLPEKMRYRLDSHADDTFISTASLWEIAIKMSVDKLRLKFAFEDLDTLAGVNNLRLIGPEIADLSVVRNLFLHHRDPFDRMLIAQAMTHGLTIVTRDQNIPRYGVPVLW